MRVSERVGWVLDDRYRLDALVGTGGSAAVYTARDLRLDRVVAVKVLHPALAGDDRFRRRFRAEAQATASLQHPNLVAVHDWSDARPAAPGEPTTPAYLVTEFLPGGSLRDVLDRHGRLSLSQVLLVGLDVAQGLAHAHRQGLVHRDIKPGNVLFDAEGRVRVADFGIARAVAESNWTEPAGALIGTARYAAPEQAGSGDVDGRADVYALAVTMIEMATGEIPLSRDTALATMLVRQDTDLPVPDALGVLQPIVADAGRARADVRLTAAQLVEGLLRAAPSLPRPAPLPVVMSEPTVESSDGDDDGAVLVLGDDDETIAIGVGTTASMSRIEACDRDAGDEDAADPVMTDELVTDELVPAAAGSDQVGAERLGASASEADDLDRGSSWRRVAAIVAALLGLVGVVVWQLWPDAEPTPETIEPAVGVVGDYIGRPADEVTVDVGLRGWSVVTVTSRADGFALGTVIRQSPAPGTELEEGSEISLVVSEGFELREVPVLEGLPLAEAMAALTDSHLFVGDTAEEFSETVPERHIISASLEPGTEVESGTRVDVVWSMGPAPRTVPEAAGRPQVDVVSELEGAGLVVVVSEDYSTAVDEGLVIAIEPTAGTQVARGSEVGVVVSLGLPFITVPDVTGQGAAAAAEALEDAGLVVVDTEGPPNAEVLATSPPAGESVRLGESVVIFTRR